MGSGSNYANDNHRCWIDIQRGKESWRLYSCRVTFSLSYSAWYKERKGRILDETEFHPLVDINSYYMALLQGTADKDLKHITS